MTRLHDAFDVVVDRGDPVGSDILMTRARDAVARGAIAELQTSPPGNRTRFRIVIAAALCVAAVAGLALVSRGGSAPPANRRPGSYDCRGSVASRTKHVKLTVARNARAHVSIGAFSFRFAIVVRRQGELWVRASADGPGLGSGSSVEGGPLSLPNGHVVGTVYIAGGPITFTCTR